MQGFGLESGQYLCQLSLTFPKNSRYFQDSLGREVVGLNGLGEFSLSLALLAGYAGGLWDGLVCLAPGLGLLLLQMPKCPAH